MNQTIVESAAVRPAIVLHGGVADQPTIRERAVISASIGTTGLIAGQDAIIRRATGCASATAADVPAQRAIVEQTAECPPAARLTRRLVPQQGAVVQHNPRRSSSPVRTSVSHNHTIG